jgi:hypothetical protein
VTELFRARYRIGSYLPLEKAAAVLAGEQSSGTFTQVPGETAELKEKHAARVAGVTPIDDLTERLPGLEPRRRAEATVRCRRHRLPGRQRRSLSYRPVEHGGGQPVRTA